MGNGYNQQLHHQILHLNHKGTFLPILCSKPSIKDVTIPTKWQDKSASFTDDPLSPKISCMGQVKRNNRIVELPASQKFNLTTAKNSCSNNNNNNIKYFKLRRLFSAKSLTSSPVNAAAATATKTTSSSRRREVSVNSTSRPKNGGKDNSASIDIENMDPPLPVIKKVPKQSDKGDGETLWQRRSLGVSLKSLQLQQIQLNRHQEPTTV